MAQEVTDRMAYPKALTGRYEPRQDLPDWMRVPRWCTTDAPPWGKGETTALVEAYAARHANTLRLGMFWGGFAHYPSAVAPHSPNLRPGTDPLAEAVETTRRHGMHLLAYINPNAYREGHPLFESACLRDEAGKPWDIRAYGMAGTRYACSTHPEFARFYTAAIRELVAERGAEGIYVDGLTPHVCYCEHCRAAFKRDTGRDLPAGLAALGPFCVLWEMTSDWDLVGDVRSPDHQLYSRWLMGRLTALTRLFAETARAARPGAVVVFHSWPKPDIVPYYDATLNEIYASRPWHFTLWKRAEFANWGDVFSVPSLVNIYLRQEPWSGEKRKITTEVEARHLYWQVLANGGYPNAWATFACAEPFAVMEKHADCFDFAETFPVPFLGLPRPMFTDARHAAVAGETGLPLRAGKSARLRILEREAGGKVDILCLRADRGKPSDEEARSVLGGRAVPEVLYVRARDYDAGRSVTTADESRWTAQEDGEALSGACVTSAGHGNVKDPKMPLEYALPAIEASGPWALWARVIFPNVGSDSFFWQVSNDDGETWLPEKPRDGCAVGWEQPQRYAWVRAGMDLASVSGAEVDRFLSPATGAFAALLHAGLPVKQMHPNHLTPAGIQPFQVLVLANEVALSDDQCAWIRDFVRAGGGLIATHETSLYDLHAGRRKDLGLADVLGVTLRGCVVPRQGQVIRPTGNALPGVLPGEGIPNREEHLLVEARGAQVAASLKGPGVPDGSAPALLLHTFGRGRVAYLPGRLDSSYSLWADKGTPDLLRALVTWVSRDTTPVQVTRASAPVGATCFDQPRRDRRLVHLLSYNADWSKSFDVLPEVKDVEVLLRAPEGKCVAAVTSVLTGDRLDPKEGPGGIRVVLPSLKEYALLEVRWATPK